MMALLFLNVTLFDIIKTYFIKSRIVNAAFLVF